MAEIVKNNDVVEKVCLGCKSLIAIGRSDLKYHSNFGHDSYLYFECPACGKNSRLIEKELPSHWQSFVRQLITEQDGDDF